MRVNPKNEQIKRRSYIYLREARHLAEETLDGVAHALRLFEIHTKGKDFQHFHIQQAVSFKAALANQPSHRTKRQVERVVTAHDPACLEELLQMAGRAAGFQVADELRRRRVFCPIGERDPRCQGGSRAAGSDDRADPARDPLYGRRH